MADNKLIDYIKLATNGGLNKEQIIQQLKDAGWNERDISDAFLSVASESAVTDGSIFGITQTSSFLEKVLSVFKTKTFLTSISVLLILLCIFVGLAYSFGIWPFSGASKYSKNDLFDAMLDNIQGVNSIFYSADISLLTQPSSSQTKPLDLLSMEFKNNGEKEKLERDAKRFSDLSSIISMLSNYLYKGGISSNYKIAAYPPTLLAAGITLKDPLGQDYQYKPSADKKHYTLMINFETDKAIDTINDQAQNLNVKKPAISGKTVLFTENSLIHYYYLDNQIQQPVLVEMVQEVNNLATYLPGEFNGKFKFSGNTQTNEQNVADMSFQLGGDVKAGDLSISADAEFIKKDADYYFRINKFPNLFFDVSEIKNKWVKVGPDDLERGIAGFAVDEIKPAAQQNGQVLDKIRTFFKLAKEESIFIINGLPTEEKINNQKTYHYSVSVDQEKFKNFYKKIVLEFNSKFGEDSPFKNEGAVLSYLDTPEFDNLFQYFKNNAKFDIWINKQTTYPVKISFGLAIIPDGTGGYGADKKNQELSLLLNLETKNINQKTDIKAPKEFLAFTEAQELLFPGQKDSRLKSDLAQARSLAELYANLNSNSYYGFDKDKQYGGGVGGQWELLKKDIISQGVSVSNIKENYTKDKYVIQVKIAEGWWCIDSSGMSKQETVDKFITGQTVKCP
jgi:hypothetical protein